ncbi:Pancreatic lipase-related protein 2 [Armadillidium nasatum]|uniref:Pancreatic lipase-related protein 2 n=1 Tax=Armadillidium nasatum TaxID=96803 RepID=A0A5N5T1T0_9CRUS|nr:Pancreatic lipase-related protein 2 [Armadillidium nasatum]
MKTRKPNSSYTAFTPMDIDSGSRIWLQLYYNMEITMCLRVDWGKGSLTLPDQALANTKVVGEEIAYFVNTLKGELNVNVSKCHCIGHSMGGYVCGFAGQGIDKLGRITALDPAPKEFFEVENNEKLDPSDAEFVDAIHTGFSLLNILPSIAVPQPVGHLDFYVNEGHYQTGCYLSLTSLLNPTNNLEEDLIDLVSNEVTCGHLRPITYYIESILNPSCQWVSYECSSFEQFQKGECSSCGTDSSNCGLLGPRAIEYTDKSRENVVLFIKTAAKSPFCVQHYVVSISTGIIVQDESPSGGVITFEVIGSTGYFTEKLEIKKLYPFVHTETILTILNIS